MRCPCCKIDDDKVIDTRTSEDGCMVRRRRECLGCGFRYTTHESLDDLPLRVLKKNGTRQPFSRDKVLAGVMRALEKRPIASEAASVMVERIERGLLHQGVREITSREVGALVMAALRALDEVAYVRFASVYREFQAVDEFISEIREIRPDSALSIPVDPGSAAEFTESAPPEPDSAAELEASVPASFTPQMESNRYTE